MNLLLPGFLFVAIASAGLAAPDADERLDRKPDKKREIGRIEYVTENGKERNFGGRRLVWTGPGDCSQKEQMEPIMEVRGNGASIRNAWIDEAPEGIHVNGKNVVIENVVFPKVCEDAITANGGADNLVIRNCAFRGARDKAIQLNAGTNIVIEDCYFEDCHTPIRVKAAVTVTVRNNVSRGGKFFVFANGEGAKAVVENNRVDGAERMIKADDEAVVILRGNEASRIRKENETDDGAEIEIE